jgi:Tol biopolymer transport system component
VLFYSKPADGPAGAWTVDLSGNLAPFWPRFGYTAAGDSLTVSADGDVTRVERLDGSLSLTLANGGVETLPSPDGRQVAYLDRLRPGGRTGDSLERVIVAALDGGAPRGLLDVARADYLRWFPDGRRLAVFGWRPDGTSPGLWVIETDSGNVAQVVAANFLTAIEVSPDGQWLAYLATLQPNPDDNGVWVVRPDGGERRRLPHARAFRWAADSQALLALTPAPGGKEIHRIDLATGARAVLVGRDQVDFDVDADDWSVAPDGRHLLYRSARDRALWALRLGP